MARVSGTPEVARLLGAPGRIQERSSEIVGSRVGRAACASQRPLLSKKIFARGEKGKSM